jgi:hypothetical protein
VQLPILRGPPLLLPPIFLARLGLRIRLLLRAALWHPPLGKRSGLQIMGMTQTLEENRAVVRFGIATPRKAASFPRLVTFKRTDFRVRMNRPGEERSRCRKRKENAGPNQEEKVQFVVRSLMC